ncbi:C45 family autoproteolytic acyltransferase/hydolase [Brevibacillus marinus]|uniref:C45 family autoproteolytic acyltransferase/hydolase n=1 Tax=Brevibacillus marinus TaxID=2496837 RepID=UPI000F826585|nr:C45 family peptidase [Brevibacillus marinus]
MSEQPKGHTEARSTKRFPFYRFRGTHRQIGRQYGEACADLIRRHLDLALKRLQSRANLPRRSWEEAVLQYRPYVLRYAPFFDEEIQGVAEGAGISLAEAYFLQLRAEIYSDLQVSNECTTFAILPEATTDGTALIGQNADLPALYSEIGVVLEIIPDDGPACLMLTPAGQVSYIGINDQGMGVFGNFLSCDGWRVGFPRYLFSRFALTHRTVDEAVAALRSVYRASSRNLIMLDRTGRAVDMETTATEDALIEPENGLLAHTNHYISEDLRDKERAPAHKLENSRARLQRIRTLLKAKRGQLNAEVMQDILRDRGSFPHCLCIMPGDEKTDNITFASVIAEPSKGQLWIAIGPPNMYEYHGYAFSQGEQIT